MPTGFHRVRLQTYHNQILSEMILHAHQMHPLPRRPDMTTKNTNRLNNKNYRHFFIHVKKNNLKIASIFTIVIRGILSLELYYKDQ